MKETSFREEFLADTHGLIWHFASDNRLSTEARRRFEMADRGEAVVYLSSISLIEMYYLVERKKVPHDLWELFLRVFQSEDSDSYRLVDVTYPIALSLTKVPKSAVPEMPDRIIAATALHLNLPLITRDRELQKWEGLVTVW